jgi:hypothetical protein
MAERRNALPETLRQQLDEAHRGLLRVHKALLDYERGRYEAVHGAVGGPGAFLQLVIHDPAFAWLRAVSEFVVQIDEWVSAREPREVAEGEALLAQARGMLTPAEEGEEFQRRYFQAIRESDVVAEAHAEWRLSVRRGDVGG